MDSQITQHPSQHAEISNVALRARQLVASHLPFSYLKQERSWLQFEVSGSFCGGEPFDGFGGFPDCCLWYFIASFHVKAVQHPEMT